jgi:ubiquinone/menaquinone biosynthesis C-methylase UbiE
MNTTFPRTLSILKHFATMSSKSPKYSSNYERMTGNCTRILASQMISELSVPITSSSYILDNACGPGIASEQIKLKYPEVKVMATDLSPGMIESVGQKIKENGWSNMETDILDVRSLSTLKDQTFTHVITNLGLPVPNDPESGLKATKEIYRVLKVGGVAMLTTWAGIFPFLFQSVSDN